MSEKIYCFNHVDLAAVRVCFSNPDADIGNGTVDKSGALRILAHDWETFQPAAHAAMLASGKVRVYANMAAMRAAEAWVEWTL